jgi:uncharacterized protein
MTTLALRKFIKRSSLLAAVFVFTGVIQAQTPKKLLVVTVTKGFRHSSIPTAEKVLGELAQRDGSFTVDYVRNDQEMTEKMTADALQKYDGAIFANTTGDLPLPDKQAFLDWIKSGRAFIGMHSATDTFRGHKPLDSYVEMIGGEFKTHGAQVEVECINQDAQHAACRHLASSYKLKDEIYILNGFERGKVHGLLTLDKHPNEKTPGDYPIAWCKEYGKGRVFYTSLGHREDVWDAHTPANFKRENPVEVSEAYQRHILSGIKWALGLEKGDAKPQTK